MDLFGEEPQPEEEIEEEVVETTPAEEPALSPRTTSLCLGHENIESQLVELHASGRMPHALVFTGPAGIGKSVMAYRLARFMLKNDKAARNFDIDANDPVFRRVASGGHADFLGIERGYDSAKNRRELSVPIAEIRRITPFLRHTSSNGGWRVVIVDDADTMTRSSQNGLLKILEEPPANAILILVAHRMGALVPTIRSRARVVHFKPLPQDTLETLLHKHGYAFAPDELETLFHISGGSVGRALSFIEEEGLDTLGRILEMFENYPAFDWPKVHALADDLGLQGRDQAFTTFAALMPWIAAQLTLAKARGEGSPRHPLQIKPLTALVQNSSLAHLSEICENLQGHFETLQRASLDKRQGVLQAFSIMQKAA